jgi:shikimate dehydrogenase
MTDRYLVLGHPIAHSQSPKIHALFAAQTGQDMSYAALDVEPGTLPDVLERVIVQEGVVGMNVTVPYKTEAFELCDMVSPRARRARAVNTLLFNVDALRGDNTDGVGLMRDLKNLGFEVEEKRILILGAGGAVRGILEPILRKSIDGLCIANRTVEKAEALVKEFVDLATTSVEALSFEALAEQQPFDAVINATSASLSGDLPPLPEHLLTEDAWAYDLMYAAQPTPFMQWASAHGARVADGLGMLVEQAAESFSIWRGVRPQTAPVIEAIRAQLKA